MASFKAPKAVVFVEALPKNPSGKLLKRDLRDSHAALFAASLSDGRSHGGHHLADK
jgi:fatty-acyl-CoA synthase